MTRWKSSVSAKAGTLWRRKEGELMWTPLVMLTFTVLFMTMGMNLFNTMLTYQRVNYITKTITKTIELEGQMNQDAWMELSELNKSLGTHATMEITNVRYFNASQKTIQFRSPFTVTVKDTYSFPLLTPTFADPVVLKIPISSTLPGMSEVYWK